MGGHDVADGDDRTAGCLEERLGIREKLAERILEPVSLSLGESGDDVHGPI
jgi:hypothetical protein